MRKIKVTKIKSLSTPYKIIKILNIMTKNPVSIDEILSTFENEGIFIERETISKYFATLRNAGCNIQKKRNKFYINFPALHFSQCDFSTLAEFQKTISTLNSKNNYSYFLKFLDKLFALCPKSDIDNYNIAYKKCLTEKSFLDEKTVEKYKNKIEIFSEFINNTPQKVKIIYEEKRYNITPLNFRYYKNSISLLAYDNNKNVNKNFLLDKITSITRIPSISANTEFGLATTFKLKGRLKNTYILKEGETGMARGDYMLVTNKTEDKNELFNRLLKYGTNCEILYPKSDRENFLNLIKRLRAGFGQF